MGTVRRITERVAAPFSGCKVDREAGVLRGALICGPSSANERDYLPGAFGDGARYEGRSIYVDHADARTGRALRDKIGWWEGVTIRPDGMPAGDAHLLKSHPLYAQVMEAAERNPRLMGFSHVARCRTRYEAGREKVEAVEEVESVDLVAEPATTNGIFESKGGGAVPTTLRKVLESLESRSSADRRKLLRKVLVEADDMGGYSAAAMDAPVAEEPADETDPDQAIDDAFKQAMHAQVDALLNDSHTLAEFLSKCRELYKSRAKIMGKPADAAGESGGDGKAEESRKKAGPDPWEVLAECKREGYDPTPSQLKALARMADPAERAEFVRECKEARAGDGERPRSAGRHQTGAFTGEQDAARKVAEGKGGQKDGGERLHWED